MEKARPSFRNVSLELSTKQVIIVFRWMAILFLLFQGLHDVACSIFTEIIDEYHLVDQGQHGSKAVNNFLPFISGSDQQTDTLSSTSTVEDEIILIETLPIMKPLLVQEES